MANSVYDDSGTKQEGASTNSSGSKSTPSRFSNSTAGGSSSFSRGDALDPALDQVRKGEGGFWKPNGDSTGGQSGPNMGSSKTDDFKSNAPSPRNLSDREASGGEGGGLARNYGTGNSSSTSPKKARFGITRKRAIIGVGSSSIIGVAFTFLSISSGPLQVIHYAQLLGKSGDSQSDANGARLGRDIRWARTGNIGETRIGYISSKLLMPKIKADFADEGIKINTKFGSITTLNIDTSAPDSKYGGLSEAEAKAAIAADYGVDISQVTTAADNTWEVPVGKLGIGDTKSVFRNYVKGKNLGTLATEVRVRVFERFYNLPGWFRPIDRLSAEGDKAVAKGLGKKSTEPGPVKDLLDKIRNPITTRSQAAVDVIAKVKGKFSGTPVKIAGGVLIGTTALCVAKDVAHEIPDLNRLAVAVPAIESAGQALALGSHGEAGLASDGSTLSAAAYGAVVKGFSDSDGKTVWDGAAIQSLNAGSGSGGPDISPDVKQAFSPDSSAVNIDNALNAAGADALCSTLGQIAQGVAGIGLLVVAGPTGGLIGTAVKATVGAVGTAAVVQGIETLVPKLVADKPVTGTPNQGPQGGNVAAYGARELFNSESRTMGGTAVSDTTSAMLDRQQNLADAKQFQSESFASRLFDTQDYRSLASRIIDGQNPNVAHNVASLFASFTHIGSSLLSSVASLMPHALAANKPYDYGFPKSIIDERLLSKSDQALIDDFRTNADAVAQLLDNTSVSQPYIDKAMKCTGVQLDNKGSDGLWDPVPKNDVNPSSSDYIDANCGDVSDKNWLRVRYFIWDTGIMEGWACVNADDDQSCQNSGISPSSSSGSTSSGTTSTAGATIDMAHLTDPSKDVACAPNTKDIGVYDGYTSGNKIQIRLCAISNLPSSGSEANGGYNVSGANGKCPLNSRVSGDVFAMVQAAQQAGVTLTSDSCYRSMAHQQCLYAHTCGSNTAAAPGTSNHQMGVAIDFSVPKCDAVINGQCSDPGNPMWDWLSKNAAQFNYKSGVSDEAWHWSPTGN